MALHLGIDSSKQSLTALIIDEKEGKIVLNEAVNFEKADCLNVNL